ncbi:hypothetical protein BDQ12DRAFT_48480 [Crucibulum laeve]|uniref:Uncharacterized protein n=1 Tax=Crucibulum laeve TaxID=68775 RepID=A0A5C3MK79_9AGAR|nr:hypothetical protein BDQ12DRAFT_48480 [Crucibulum laeve]
MNVKLSSFRQSEELSCDEWISVLKLSTIWQFPQVRARSVTALEGMSMDALKKLECARDYNLPQWYASALTQVAERSNLMSPQEAVKIMGLEFGLKMAELHGMIAAYSRAIDDFYGGSPKRRLKISRPNMAEMTQVFISLVFSKELLHQAEYVDGLY